MFAVDRGRAVSSNRAAHQRASVAARGGQRPLGSSHRPTCRAMNGHWGDTEGPAHSYAAEEFMQRDGIACGGNGASSPDLLSREEEGDCGGLLFLERSWTADERTVPKIKSQEAVRIPRNADPNALPDFAGFVVPASEP